MEIFFKETNLFLYLRQTVVATSMNCTIFQILAFCVMFSRG